MNKWKNSKTKIDVHALFGMSKKVNLMIIVIKKFNFIDILWY